MAAVVAGGGGKGGEGDEKGSDSPVSINQPINPFVHPTQSPVPTTKFSDFRSLFIQIIIIDQVNTQKRATHHEGVVGGDAVDGVHALGLDLLRLGDVLWF